MQENVKQLINDIGVTVTVRYYAYGNYDVATGTVSSTNSDTTGKALVLNYSDSLATESVVKRGDRKIVLSGTDFAKPSTEDKVIVSTIEHSIIDIQEVVNAENTLVYILQVRK